MISHVTGHGQCPPKCGAVGLVGKVKAGITRTISSRQRPTKDQGAKDADKPDSGTSKGGFKLGTFRVGGGAGVRRTDPNTVSLQTAEHDINTSMQQQLLSLLWMLASILLVSFAFRQQLCNAQLAVVNTQHAACKTSWTTALCAQLLIALLPTLVFTYHGSITNAELVKSHVWLSRVAVKHAFLSHMLLSPSRIHLHEHCAAPIHL